MALAFFVLVRFHVFGQMVTAHEPFATVRTHEALLPRVSPQVPLQLVRPGEAFATEKPVAHERTLPRVPPQVSFQVRRLAVNLPAARYVADVLFLLARLVAGRGRLAVGAAAPPAPPRSRKRGLGVKKCRDLSLILCKVRVSQNQASLKLKAMMWTERRRVAHVAALLQAPPGDFISRVWGQLSLLLDEARHRGGNWSGRCVTHSWDVGGRGAAGLHGAGQHLDRGKVIGVRGVRWGRERQFVGRAEGALEMRGQLRLRG